MGIGIVGWDAYGQPQYGELGVGQADMSPPGMRGTATRSVNMPSTYIPGTGTQRTVNPPKYNPQPALQASAATWEREQSGEDQYYIDSLRGVQTQRQNDQNGWESVVGGQVAQIPGYYQQASADRMNNTAGLRGAFEGYNASDMAATNNFVNTNNQNLGVYNQRANDLYNTTVPMYQAQQWSSNPQDLANQNQALGNFSDIYGGGLDYQAQLATLTKAGYTNAEQTLAQLYQYASDPSDVNRQKEALGQLKGLINGGEWQDSLREVRDKYKGLSDPEVTAQERFIMEQFNQRRQDLERSNREAVMSNLEARGLRSGAAEQTGMLNSQQELGRQEVLAGLGAQANAIDRSQQAMQGWTQASGMGRQSELQAMGMYIDAAGQLRSMNDAVGLANTQWANQNSMFNAGEANDISMFNANAYNQNQMFNAGQANQTSQFNAGQTNNARANNQATRLSGAQGFANQSNQIRADNDAVGTFNVGQQNIVGMNNQQVQLQDLQRRGGVAQSQLFNNTSTGQVNLDAIKGTNAGNAGRDSVIHSAQQGDIDSRLAGQLGGAGAIIGFEDAKLAGRNNVSDNGALTASQRYGVFTPTIAQKKKNTDLLAAGGNYTYG